MENDAARHGVFWEDTFIAVPAGIDGRKQDFRKGDTQDVFSVHGHVYNPAILQEERHACMG
jgi:hypothetical protein